LLSKYQATVIGDQLIADARRRRDDQKTRRLVVKAGPKPVGLTADQFEIAVNNAEKLVLKSWILWLAVAAWSALILALLYAALLHSKSNLGGIVPALALPGILLIRRVRRQLVASYVRRQSDGDS
jgi:hypothetical protein